MSLMSRLRSADRAAARRREREGCGLKCPMCGGWLRGRVSSLTGRGFLGCERWPDCTFTMTYGEARALPTVRRRSKKRPSRPVGTVHMVACERCGSAFPIRSKEVPPPPLICTRCTMMAPTRTSQRWV
ncbi:MAG: topoisomerase DNA-binding C4 zinc finger domain-containing protein [Phycisphaerae bacterium]|nr:topoisomerase DNA-binding C4 zinc finger domain-containing protein [Phycisphaerae bacterium]